MTLCYLAKLYAYTPTHPRSLSSIQKRTVAVTVAKTNAECYALIIIKAQSSKLKILLPLFSDENTPGRHYHRHRHTQT